MSNGRSKENILLFRKWKNNAKNSIHEKIILFIFDNNNKSKMFIFLKIMNLRKKRLYEVKTLLYNVYITKGKAERKIIYNIAASVLFSECVIFLFIITDHR